MVPYRFGQDILAQVYESAQYRMSVNPERADKQKKILQEATSYKSEKEALIAALEIEKKKPYSCQIWARIEKNGDLYLIKDYWIATDDIDVKCAAEYIGMIDVYDETKLARIVQDNINVDDIVAYW